MKFNDVKPEVFGITFGVFIVVLYITLMRISIKLIEHPLMEQYLARILNSTEGLIPLSVIVAISLFLVKEALEYNRKRRAEYRKVKAYKQLIAEEIALNYGAFQSILGICQKLESSKDELEGAKYEAVFKEAGNLYVHATMNGRLMICSPVRKVHITQYDKLLASIAELDEQFYSNVHKGYLAVIETQHLYTSLIKGLQASENKEVFPNDITKSGFLDYALNEASRIEPELKNLYQFCVGEELERGRIR
ncbi:hypothetical protein HORM4_590013 [Vibrio harveyi]|uniref:hypothetical protein n=1 Tax=Vibrio harveyi TaxID=669 RepID=UPI002ADCE8E5|nr:hypothetical protein [Vibrio harveyi]CAK6715071.1 hypothetical protein HORM4_590013 [Vibrio harveyi]